MLLQRQQLLDDGVMFLLVFIYDGDIVFIAGSRHVADFYEGVREAAYRRADQDGPVPFNGPGNYIHYFRHIGGIGYRCAAELKYLHIFNVYSMIIRFLCHPVWTAGKRPFRTMSPPVTVSL